MLRLRDQCVSDSGHDSKDGKSLRERLKESLDESPWSWLRRHAARDAVILVKAELDLLDVGEAVAKNESKLISAWVESGKIGKPTEAQLEAWEKVLDKKFLVVVVQPFVLAQEHLVH